MVADEISELEWQMWVDRLSREGLSRSRIAGHASGRIRHPRLEHEPESPLRNP